MISALLCAIAIDTIGKLKALPEAEYLRQIEFTLEGQVLSSSVSTVIVDDGRERICLHNNLHNPVMPTTGSVVRLTGYTDLGRTTREKWPVIRDFTVLGQRPLPPVIDVTPADLRRHELEYRAVRLRAFITDVFEDEIDSDYRYLLLDANGEHVYAVIPREPGDEAAVAKLPEAEAELTGTCTPLYCGHRMFLGLHLGTSLSRIRILTPAPADPFDVPELEDLANVSPETVFRLRRRRVSGEVLAVWAPGRILIRNDRRILRADLLNTDRLPATGSRITVSGFPTTDFYHLNLVKAAWQSENAAAAGLASADHREGRALSRPRWQTGQLASADLREGRALSRPRWQTGQLASADDTEVVPPGEDTPETVSAAAIVRSSDHQGYDPLYHGRLITLTGIVRTLPGPRDFGTRFLLESDGVQVPVELSALGELDEEPAIGCRIAVTGICVMESENWRADAPFPRITGFFLVPRRAADIAILTRPPWWTPRLLLGIIGTLLAVLVGFFIWNRFLNRLVEKRSRQLIKQEIARVGSELRVDERTRLAVELHDSLSQTLTGVSFQIDAAERARKQAPDQIGIHLDTARRTLQSCRAELRNCLWDLRNNALEETDTETAIRRTIAPHLGEAEAVLDLELPRRKISDLTFHAILRIVRELTVNAIRHGGARRVEIGGRLDDTGIVLTVRDDGRGFDPGTRPGSDDGHFGLDGIRERLDRLGGELSITSAPGGGAAITITLRQTTGDNRHSTH